MACRIFSSCLRCGSGDVSLHFQTICVLAINDERMVRFVAGQALRDCARWAGSLKGVGCVLLIRAPCRKVSSGCCKVGLRPRSATSGRLPWHHGSFTPRIAATKDKRQRCWGYRRSRLDLRHIERCRWSRSMEARPMNSSLTGRGADHSLELDDCSQDCSRARRYCAGQNHGLCGRSIVRRHARLGLDYR